MSDDVAGERAVEAGYSLVACCTLHDEKNVGPPETGVILDDPFVQPERAKCHACEGGGDNCCHPRTARDA